MFQCCYLVSFANVIVRQWRLLLSISLVKLNWSPGWTRRARCFHGHDGRLVAVRLITQLNGLPQLQGDEFSLPHLLTCWWSFHLYICSYCWMWPDAPTKTALQKQCTVYTDVYSTTTGRALDDLTKKNGVKTKVSRQTSQFIFHEFAT